MKNTPEKQIKTTSVQLSMLEKDEFTPPSKWYFINAMSEAIFIHCRDRVTAESYITENYGKGFYKLRTSSLEKSKGDLTCRGSNSRKCFSPRLRPTV